jgi:hypothetical protein
MHVKASPKVLVWVCVCVCVWEWWIEPGSKPGLGGLNIFLSQNSFFCIGSLSSQLKIQWDEELSKIGIIPECAGTPSAS